MPAGLRARLYERAIRSLPHTILAACVGGALLLVAWQEPALSALSIAWLVRPALAHRVIERLGERLTKAAPRPGALERGSPRSGSRL
jgi:RsiW-degrading membrane proteinase PrsW (M82 family)